MLEITTLLLLAGNSVFYDREASFIVSSDTEVVGVLEPGLCQALERLAKKKGFHSSFMWYWTGEYNCQCSVDNLRRFYFLIDTLPVKENFATLPPMEYISKRCLEGSGYHQYLVSLREFAQPWDKDRIDALIEEGDIFKTIWDQAWTCRNLEKELLYGRLALKKLEELLDGAPVSEVLGVPSYPSWRIPLSR